MNLDPDVARLFAEVKAADLPTLTQLTPGEARPFYLAQIANNRGPLVAMAAVRDIDASGRAGLIPLRLYRPHRVPGEDAPLLVYLHGGGWVVGGLDSHDRVCREIAERAGCLVAAVDYRLAPEHPAPAAAEDALDAFRWIVDHAGTLGADAGRLAVGGDSAGGNLSAVIALAARDEGIALRAQVLIYPAVDLRDDADYASRTANADMPPLNAAAMHYFRSRYVADEAVAADWRLSPIAAADKAGVAPALVVVAEGDILHDEGLAYAEDLRRAGVEAEVIDVPGMIHGFITMGGKIGASGRTLAAIGEALRRRLA